MNYYERHIGDLIKDTVGLTMTEDGAYNRLMDQGYQTEQPLPNDIKEIYRLARANSSPERKAVDYVLGKYFTKTAEGYVQKRIQAEIAKYQDKQRKAKASADARWSKDRSQSDGNANASESQHAPHMRTHSDGNALQTPDTSNHPPSQSSGDSAAALRPPRQKRDEITLATYLVNCKAEARKPLPADHPIRDYCRDAGISEEMLAVAWCVFRDDYTSGTNKAKRYKDWPGHFANAVRGCWSKLWYTDSTAGVAWTSRGLQEKSVLDARAKAREVEHEPA